MSTRPATSASIPSTLPFWRDPWLLAFCIAGFVLRILPVVVEGAEWQCTQDECGYVTLGHSIRDGQGMADSIAWIWAPAYPAILALHIFLFGSAVAVTFTQAALSLGVGVALYLLALRIQPDQVRESRLAARVASAAYLLSPTQIFYSARTWSESLYGVVLVGLWVCLVALVRRARANDQGLSLPGLSMVIGVGVGLAMLFRGVATCLPIAIALWLAYWLRPFAKWARAVLIIVAAAAVVVTPYSVYATHRFGGFVLTERTLGQALWNGNNTFLPVTFDHALSMHLQKGYRKQLARARPRCVGTRGLVCDERLVAEGLAWIKDNPGKFVSRAPIRVAHMLNPHTFLTRHLRAGGYPWLAPWVQEGLIAINAAWSIVILCAGTFGLLLFGGTTIASAGWLFILYHMAVIAALFGMSRFRVPIEPMWMLGTGLGCAFGREALRDLRNRRTLRALAGALLLLPFVLNHFATGWQTFERPAPKSKGPSPTPKEGSLSAFP